jgi:glycosyltransferase involved in cell wall biosynthesis
MKVLMVSDFYPPFAGGVEMVVATLSQELVRRGHKVTVVTLAAPDLPPKETAAGVEVLRIRSSAQRATGLFATSSRPWAPPVPDPEALVALRAAMARERPDVVHGHDWLARSFLPLKRRGGPSLVMSLHYFTLTCPKKSLMYEGRPCSGPGLGKCLACAGRHYGPTKGTVVVLGQRAFSRAEARKVDLFLPVSAAAAEGNGLSASGLPFEVVPNLVATAGERNHPSERLSLLPHDPFLLFVGDLRRVKGIEVLLEAYRALVAPPPLVLIGKVWPESPRDLPDGVSLARDWPNAAVREAMARCLALVVPSVLPEPFGMVIVEAFAAGRPVVASAVGGIPEIVRDGREGLLVPPGDSAALASELERLIQNADLQATLARNARKRAAAYAPAAVVPRFEDAYERARRRSIRA